MDSGVITVTRRLKSENVGSIPTRFFYFLFRVEILPYNRNHIKGGFRYEENVY